MILTYDKWGPFGFHRQRQGVDEYFWGLLTYDRFWRRRDAALNVAVEHKEKTRAEMLAMLPVETAIEFIGGLPGGGKSMLSMRLVIKELVESHRPIVTNLPINLARLQEYLDLQGTHIHVAARVYLLPHEEVKTFYLRRGQTLLVQPKEMGADGTAWLDWVPSQTDKDAAGGVFYVIDECHNYFHPNAFDKVKMSPEHPLFQWASQHRKLKDRCYFVTQSVENVHVSIRRLGALFNYVTNQRKQTYRGFSRGDGFEVTSYLKQPKSDAEVYVDRSKFKLDVVGLASCYATAGGVGVAAKGSGDGGSKKKSVSVKWVWFGFFGILAAMAVVGWFLPKILVKKVMATQIGQLPADMATVTRRSSQAVSRVEGGGKLAQHEADISVVSVPVAAPVSPEQGPAASSSAPLASSSKHPSPDIGTGAAPVAVTCLGVIRLGNKFNVVLSDGSTRSEEDGTVLAVRRHFVVLTDLGRIWMRALVTKEVTLAIKVIEPATEGKGAEGFLNGYELMEKPKLPPSPPSDFKR